MIETYSDLLQFQTDNAVGDWFVHAIPLDDGVHSADNTPLLLFIRNISTKKTYHYSLGHPDSTSIISEKEVFDCCKGKLWALDAKSFKQLFDVPVVYDANLCGYFEKNEVLELTEYETFVHKFIRRNNGKFAHQINRTIPLLKHKEMFDDLADDISRLIRRCKVDDAFVKFNDLIHILGEVESNGIYVDADLFKKHFNLSPNKHGLVYSQYNFYTATGRPSNSFNNVNYAALQKNDGCRSSFVSRHGNNGRMVVVDYSAFHPRIICQLTNYSLSSEIDFYEYMAKLYFQKKEVDETDIANAKSLTFRQLFGGVDDKYSHIKYLANLKSYINEQWYFYKANGYVETPLFKRKITDKHIKEPNPSKVFNYLLQAVEGEFAITLLQPILAYLQEKKTKAVLYTYDAVLYDFHKDDGIKTLDHIRHLMSNNGMFPMKTYIGGSYDDVKLVNV
jgi:hypothetical protein